MRIVGVSCLVVAGFLGTVGAAQAAVRISIDLSSQTMHVSSAGGEYDWPISSARSGFSTPRGSYAPTSLQVMHYSRKYHNSPMPHSIFFRGGYAIHGTYSVADLGRPASHGCIRLSPANAANLFAMVRAEGARIAITGTPPGGTMYARRAAPVYAAQPPGYDPARYGAPLGYRAQPDYYARPLAYAPAPRAATSQGFFFYSTGRN